MLLGIPTGELALLAVAVIVAGIFTGLLAGLLGIGGAAITVPLLYEFFRYLEVPEEVRMPLGVGTSLAVIVPVSLRSYFAHRAKSAVLNDVLRIWIVPVMVGVICGAGIAFFAPQSLFKIVFVVVGAAMRQSSRPIMSFVAIAAPTTTKTILNSDCGAKNAMPAPQTTPNMTGAIQMRSTSFRTADLARCAK